MVQFYSLFAGLLAFVPHPYFVPFLGAVIGGEETILVITALAAGGAFTFIEVLLLSYAGTLVSDLLWFLAGRRFSTSIDSAMASALTARSSRARG